MNQYVLNENKWFKECRYHFYDSPPLTDIFFFY